MRACFVWGLRSSSPTYVVLESEYQLRITSISKTVSEKMLVPRPMLATSRATPGLVEDVFSSPSSTPLLGLPRRSWTPEAPTPKHRQCEIFSRTGIHGLRHDSLCQRG